jgi:UDP-N-acetylglucosamine diphosphorylase/glucosamine-1-phosphate N-acetyltransferase
LVRNQDKIFIEPGARMWGCTLNAEAGPIYIGSNAEIMEGANLRGPLSVGADAVVKMGARIYGATTIGPACTVGGEIKNSIFMGYSNKGHDGYLGDSIIGEWCNLGAGCSNSNIKNNAAEVRVWNKATAEFESAGQKCGLLMGDYSRAAINTSFNTGTVVGIGANVFGKGLTPKYIPDFSWGWESNHTYHWEALIRDLDNWKKLKNKTLSAEDIRLLEAIFAKIHNNP